MKSSSKTKPIYESRITGAADAVQGVYDANKGYDQQTADTLRNGFNTMSSRAFGANPYLDNARSFANDTVGGKYLTNNPYVDQMATLARNNAGDSVNAMFGKMGGIGSSAHMQNLGRGMSEAELGVRSGIYSQERQNQMAAAGMQPGLDAAQYNGIQPMLALSEGAANAPYTGVNNLASGVGGLLGQYTKVKNKGSIAGLLAQMAGNAASAYAGGGA